MIFSQGPCVRATLRVTNHHRYVPTGTRKVTAVVEHGIGVGQRDAEFSLAPWYRTEFEFVCLVRKL